MCGSGSQLWDGLCTSKNKNEKRFKKEEENTYGLYGPGYLGAYVVYCTIYIEWLMNSKISRLLVV